MCFVLKKPRQLLCCTTYSYILCGTASKYTSASKGAQRVANYSSLPNKGLGYKTGSARQRRRLKPEAAALSC